MILYSKVYGNNSKHLLIFHGLFGMSDNWKNIGQELSSYFTVHTIDLRNHGKSFHSNKMNLLDLANDIFNYINFNKIDNLFILGHSLGGKAVIEFILNYSHKSIIKIIIVDIAPKEYFIENEFIIKALNSIEFEKFQSRREIEKYLTDFIPNIQIIQFLLKSIFWNKNNKMEFRFNLKVITQNYKKLMTQSHSKKTCNYPILFIQGENSNYILERDKILIKKQFNNAQFSQITNAGHWVHSDNPKEFIKKILLFLS